MGEEGYVGFSVIARKGGSFSLGEKVRMRVSTLCQGSRGSYL
jgi:hypothetical protein